MPFKQVNGWWCQKCQCLMMVKTRRSDNTLVSCDCIDVQLPVGNGQKWLEEIKLRINNLKKRQREWKRLYIEE